MKKNNTIDLIIIFSSLYKKRNTLFKTFILSIIISSIYSLTLSNQYKSTSTFYPHYDNEMTSNNLRNIAGLAGINLRNEDSDNIPPNLYPKLISSTSFKLKLLNQKINYENRIITFRDYLIESENSNFINKVFNQKLKKYNNINNHQKKLRNENLTYINQTDDYLFKYLNSKIIINVNEKDGFVELNVYDKNPMISSEIAIKANEILQKSIIDFKLKNINDIFKFTSDQLLISKNRLFKLQDSIATFRDSNISIKSDLFMNKLSRLETELSIAKNIYNELAITKEKTAIDVRKNTPIFTIINNVVVPNEKDSPNRILFIIVITFLSIFISSFWLIIKDDSIKVFKKILNG